MRQCFFLFLITRHVFAANSSQKIVKQSTKTRYRGKCSVNKQRADNVPSLRQSHPLGRIVELIQYGANFFATCCTEITC